MDPYLDRFWLFPLGTLVELFWASWGPCLALGPLQRRSTVKALSRREWFETGGDAQTPSSQTKSACHQSYVSTPKQKRTRTWGTPGSVPVTLGPVPGTHQNLEKCADAKDLRWAGSNARVEQAARAGASRRAEAGGRAVKKQAMEAPFE